MCALVKTGAHVMKVVALADPSMNTHLKPGCHCVSVRGLLSAVAERLAASTLTVHVGALPHDEESRCKQAREGSAAQTSSPLPSSSAFWPSLR